MIEWIRGTFVSRKRLLFICSQNALRSRTADTVFSERKDVRVRSAGTASNARVRVDRKLIDWADVILVMENEHLEHLLKHFQGSLDDKRVVVLEIPDDYDYMQRELIELLELKLEEHLGLSPEPRR